MTVEVTPSKAETEDYFAAPGLSQSGMKDLAVSPMRYWYLHINPERPEREETAAMRLGTALHCAVLESDEVFMDRYACALDPAKWPVCLDTIGDLRQWITDQGDKPKGTRKDEVIQQALALMERNGVYVPILAEEERKFAAANAGKTVLALDEWAKIVGMSEALRNEPEVQKILSEGEPEAPLSVIDPETGIKLKGKLDWKAAKTTLDIKTFATVGKTVEKAIADAIYYNRYYVQAYFYTHLRQLAGEGDTRFIFAFVENEPPYEVRLKSLAPTFGGEVNVYWDRARIEVKHAIRTYAECLRIYGEKPWREEQKIEALTDEDVKQFAY